MERAMHIESLPSEFQKALPILTTIVEAGYEAYFVGGSVRDMLLGKAIHDVDIATSAYPSEIKALFEKTVDTGIEHGTVMVLDHGAGYEITTFRTESGYTDYRRPDEVIFVRDLREDLKRRDFTINALAMNKTGEIIDLFDGLLDLDKKVIKAVGNPSERFHEDALRMMRAIRFSAQLDFVIEDKTLLAINKEAPLLEKIAIERINVEFTKMLMGQAAAKGLFAFTKTGLYKYVPNINIERELDLVAAGLALKHKQLMTPAVAWTFLIVQLGLDDKQAKLFLKQWKHGNDLINMVTSANHFIRLYKRQTMVTNWDLYQLGNNVAIVNAVLAVIMKDFDENELNKRYDMLTIKTKRELAITGAVLIKSGVVKPGPVMGKILLQLEQAVVAKTLDNDAAKLLAQAQVIVEGESK